MDKDRIEGMVQQGKGKLKEAAGKALGDEKLKAEGKVEQTEGKVRDTFGGIKDAIHHPDKTRH